MMTSLQVVFFLTCLLLVEVAQKTCQSSSVHQEGGFKSANVGESVTLRCFYDSKVKMFYWYKQTLGEKPKLISIFYVFSKNATFLDEYQNNPRFSVDTGNGNNHLTITNLQISDSATYYCASSFSVTFEFAEGVTVSVKGSGLNLKPSVSQSVSESIQPGGSVTLNCTVHTGTCDGEHSVYWFRPSEESPGLIYTHGGKNDQCEKNTQTHSCMYSLPMRNLNTSYAGSYYCAVASCGHIVFGKGTKLDIKDQNALVLVYVWSGAFMIVQMVFLVCVMNKSDSCLCKGCHIRSSANTLKDYQFKNSRKNMINRSRRQMDNTWTECVYRSVKQ
ncbi:signal-regulatory protein beta-2-like [Parambassis ranga]|uniref:Signal-regulatory protein beta-2-like n=1 Tax=Parambassis ranga TaxID=210632 RepID=A0A6P7K9B8_9TELE|nr:signal-regulatory protein beta-2-like [Parambassis ranga]